MDLVAKKKELIKNLKAIKRKVKPEHKSACHLEYGVSIRTQERYLNGDVDSIPVGNTLYDFFMSKTSNAKVSA